MSQSRMNPDTQINPEVIGDQVLTPDFAIDLFTSYQREYPHLAFLVQRQPLLQVQQGQQVQQEQQEEEEDPDDDDFSSSYGTVTTVDLSSAESSSALSSDDNVIPPPRSLSPTPRILWYTSSMYGRSTLTDALLELRAYCVRMMRIRVWVDSVHAAMTREASATPYPE
ncbi:hypothetical protein SLS55_006025 [Diplodia seriata]|uniref:Uncharacterized protein n=1 Tax=Diplodia seriata TaxID=420778 RepID=A0ABR3CDB7_9PEZI